MKDKKEFAVKEVRAKEEKRRNHIESLSKHRAYLQAGKYLKSG